MNLQKSQTTLGVVALLLIAFLTNWLISLLPIGNRGVDLTEDKVHTISEGTQAILQELDAPVTIHYYVTRKSDYLTEALKLYIKRVDSVLKQYESLSNGKIRIVYLDPQPDTDAEDSARLDGISGQRINEDNIYFGLSVQCFERKSTIPFLNPANETLLEYHLSNAISEVTLTDKPTIGLISPLQIAGSGLPTFPGQPAPPQPWLIYEQLSEHYTLRDMKGYPGAYDPAELDALFIVHPAGITDEAQYQIDQYLLKGGTVIAALDAFSIVAAQTRPSADPLNPTPQEGIPTDSTLPKLLPSWGLTFQHEQTLADGKYRTQLPQGLAVSILSLPEEAVTSTEEIATLGVDDLFLPFPGAFTITPKPGIEATTLVQSSPEAAFVETKRATRLDSQLALEMQPSGQQYPLVVRLTGTFPTAFPEGFPGDIAEGVTDETIQQSLQPGTVFLLPDTDFFSDQFGYRVQSLAGQRIATPTGSNTALLQNILDLCAGSRHLINARSRTSSRRPFTVIKEMETNFEQEAGERYKELEQSQAEVIQKINTLQASTSSGNLILTPEQQSELRKLENQEREFNRQIRELQKGLQTQKNALGRKVTIANIAIVPTLVLLLGLIVFTGSHIKTRAK